MPVAISSARFLATLGVNAHLDYPGTPYANLGMTEQDLLYLGIKNVRDCAAHPEDLPLWLQVAQATGVKFGDVMTEGAPAWDETQLSYVPQLAADGVLYAIEGGNEEDDPYALTNGNSLAWTAQFQQQLWAMGQQVGLPVINMSFGQGWAISTGDYATVGDLSAYTTYANAHTYPQPGSTADATIQALNNDAHLAAGSRPVITTEIGWPTTQYSLQDIARYALDATLDGIKDGDAGMYFYAMYDDVSGTWGLFNDDGSPRPVAIALHNLTMLLADTGSNAASFIPGALNYTLSGTRSGDNAALIEKSDGSFWLAIWNEIQAAGSSHTVTLTLPASATITVFDPLNGTAALSTQSGLNTASISIPDHPVLIEIQPGVTAPSPTPTPTPTPVPGVTGPMITVPGTQAVAAGASTAIAGISITDAFAAGNPGTMALNLSAATGTLRMTDGSGNTASGSGTHSIAFAGSLAQLNTELANLRYTAGDSGGADSIILDVWDQAGVEATKTIAVSVVGPSIAVPSSISTITGAPTPITGVSIADGSVSPNSGSLTLTLHAQHGTLGMTDAAGNLLAGSGTAQISVTGTLAQINADLSHLSYNAGSASTTDTIALDLVDPAGGHTTNAVSVAVAPPAAVSSGKPAVILPPTQGISAVNLSTTVINSGASAGVLLIGGSNGVIVATGASETVLLSGNNDQITTGAGNDLFRISGTGAVIDAGSGNNVIHDFAAGNRFILPAAGQGFDDIYGNLLHNSDLLDFRSLLASTTWNGQPDLSPWLHVRASGSDAIISVTPSGIASDAATDVATLHGVGPITLGTLLQHAVI